MRHWPTSGLLMLRDESSYHIFKWLERAPREGRCIVYIIEPKLPFVTLGPSNTSLLPEGGLCCRINRAGYYEGYASLRMIESAGFPPNSRIVYSQVV